MSDRSTSANTGRPDRGHPADERPGRRTSMPHPAGGDPSRGAESEILEHACRRLRLHSRGESVSLLRRLDGTGA
jgi:hypothetical protein